MALQPVCLYRGVPSSTGSTLYAVDDIPGKFAIIKSILIHNPTPVPGSVSLYSIASGDSSGADNQFFSGEIAAADTVMIDGLIVLGQDESLYGVTSNDEITVIVSGVVN